MDRLKRTKNGFTLLELMIAITLSTIVFISASNLLINFGSFTANVIKSEMTLMGAALGALEEIVGKITTANEVAIKPESNIAVPATSDPVGCVAASCIKIRVSPTGPGVSSNHADDTVYTYWKEGAQVKYQSKAGNASASAIRVIADDINSLSFERGNIYKNHITVTLKATTTGGPANRETGETLQTVVVMRSRSANML